MNSKTGTKERIIQASAYLFQIQGYHATGLNQIIKRAEHPGGLCIITFQMEKQNSPLRRSNIREDALKSKYRIVCLNSRTL